MNFRRLIMQDESGAEMAELAFVLPLLFMLLFAILWFGRAFQIYSTVNQAARAAAEAAAVPSCATCGNTFYTSCSGSSCALKTSVVDPILQAAHLDPNQVQGFTSLTGQVLNCSPPAAPPSSCPSSLPQEIGAVVTFTYPYSFRLNGFTCCPPAIVPITNGITFTAQAQARTEQ